jgi:hypothetical protein
MRMKTKKTVTEKVIAANRANAQKTTGPRNTNAVSRNALKHGLLAKHFLFQNEEEKAEFKTLLDELDDDYQPVGRTERALVEEVAVCLWKLQTANGWEIEELASRRKASKAILRTLAENYDGDQLRFFDRGDGSRSAAQLGWECEELVVRTGTRNSEQESESSSGDKNGKIGHVQIEAKLHTSVETILRYQAALKRDFYRAIAALRAGQQQRRDGSEARDHG